MQIDNPIELTRLLVRENTCTGEIEPSFVARCTAWLTALGFSVSHVELDGLVHILATIGPDNPVLRIAFVGHYDTVPVGAGWSYPAHGAVEEAGILYGRGASDMKSGDAAMIFAAIAAAKRGVHSTVFLPADEETRSEGMPALLKTVSYTFDYCLCAEPTSKVALGDCAKVGRRGVLQGSIIVQGKSGHAAYAQTTPNIINDLPRVVIELSKPWNDEYCGVETTLSITNISTDSTAVNVIPGRVQLTVDCRFAPNRNVQEIRDEIARRMDASRVAYEMALSKSTDPYLTDQSAGSHSKQATLVRATTEAITEVLRITPELTCDGGASDARFVAWQGVPTVEFGVPHGNMHGPDERVETKNIELLSQVFQAIINRLLSKPS
jgi:succinyl-diaminopimelate desuccinylase